MPDRSLTRREWLASLTQQVLVALSLGAVAAHRADAAPLSIIVYKDPSCGCCTKWVEHLRRAGLRPAVQDRTDMDALKDSLGVPHVLRSCHTAVAGRYVIEGHVPAADLERLVTHAPAGVVGLAVPGMPSGSPGMEGAGRAQPYEVIAFRADGSTTRFARH